MDRSDCRLREAPTVPTAALATLLQSLPDGGEISLVVSGESMVPFYCHRETVVILRRECTRSLRRGDAVFFLRADGTPVLHRVTRVLAGELTVGGDGQRWQERIAPTQVLARVVRVRRRPESPEVSVDAWGYRLWVRLWSWGRWWHPRAAKWCRRRYRERRREHGIQPT